MPDKNAKKREDRAEVLFPKDEKPQTKAELDATETFLDIEEELLSEGDETEESLDLIQFEHSLEELEGQDEDFEADLAIEHDSLFKTKHTDGHTNNPYLAWEQGLTYTPPDDPATLPSDDLQGVEVAAGFAPSMEETDPDVEDLPPNVDNNDLDLLDDIYIALHNNSETGHLTNIKIQVDQGVVNLLGTVSSEDDIAVVYDIVSDLDGVVEILDNLQVDEV